MENAAKNVQNKLLNMAEEDSDSGSSLVGPGLGGCGQSNKPKKVARRGGKVPEVAKVVEGPVELEGATGPRNYEVYI